MNQPKCIRCNSALVRLEQQLKSGFKVLKGMNIKNTSYFPDNQVETLVLSEKDIKRINTEIANLKAKL